MPSKSFTPISSADAKVLILGSLPGRRSLQEQRYYAQPRNSFWRIMGAMFAAGPELAYEERTERLINHGIALWDVVASAERPGSLDSAIVSSSVTVNDFCGLFDAHPGLELVCFNGAKAAELYQRRVLPTVEADYAYIRYERLPSTSPAHAAMRYDEKLERWSIIKSAIDCSVEQRRM